MDAVFRACVVLLEELAALFGISYVEINIWIFVIIWPALSILMIVTIFIQALTIRRQSRLLAEMRNANASRGPDHA